MYRVKFYSKSAPVDIRKGFRLSAVGLKNKPCKRNPPPINANTKNAVQTGQR